MSVNGCPAVARKASLKFTASKRRFSGTLTPPGACVVRQKVNFFRVKRGPDKRIRTATTNTKGAFAAKLKRTPARGRYYALAAPVTVVSAGNCGGRSRRVAALWTEDSFSATASRMSALNAASSISSPSCRSMARRTLPSRLELKSLAGSFKGAPLKKVSLTTPCTSLPADPAVVGPDRGPRAGGFHPLPLLDHLGISGPDEPAHLLRVWPRQSPSSSILASMR